MEVAYVKVGLLPSEFWDLSWREFDMITRHHEEKLMHDWDIARTVGSWSIAPHTKKKIKPSDLLKLPMDSVKRKGEALPTKEDFERIKAKYGKHG